MKYRYLELRDKKLGHNKNAAPARVPQGAASAQGAMQAFFLFAVLWIFVREWVNVSVLWGMARGQACCSASLYGRGGLIEKGIYTGNHLCDW